MRLLVIAAIVSGVGCSAAGSLYHSPEYARREKLTTSLLRGENALIPEEGIQKLLASRVQIGEKVKLAIHAFPHASLHLDTVGADRLDPMGVEFLQAKKANLEAIEKPLRATGRFVEITHVPEMLLPPDPSFTRLREIAALLQADLLVVYATRGELVSKYHLFSANEVRLRSAVELFVLDVRTGVVPYAETFDADHLEFQSKEDLKFADTQRRADREATLKVLARAGEGLAGFFARR